MKNYCGCLIFWFNLNLVKNFWLSIRRKLVAIITFLSERKFDLAGSVHDSGTGSVGECDEGGNIKVIHGNPLVLQMSRQFGFGGNPAFNIAVNIFSMPSFVRAPEYLRTVVCSITR